MGAGAGTTLYKNRCSPATLQEGPSWDNISLVEDDVPSCNFTYVPFQVVSILLLSSQRNPSKDAESKYELFTYNNNKRLSNSN